MTQPTPLLALFDGHALIHRAYHALPPLNVSRSREPVNAVFGFTSMLLKTMGELAPTYVAVAFDRAAPTFRHLEYEAYKAQRPHAPEDLIQQFQRVRQVVETFGLPIYEQDGYEADDLLGTLARQAEAQGIDTIIVTGDADTLQLITPRVRVLTTRGRFSDTILYDAKGVLERYGVSPQQFPDFKGLKGDPSDNIPGVPGIGEKTAAKLLQQFGSLEGIYQRLEEVEPPKLQDLLRQHEAIARQSKHLATIILDAPVVLDLEACRTGRYDRAQVVGLFRELEFRSLLEKLPGGPAEERLPAPPEQLHLFARVQGPPAAGGVAQATPPPTKYQVVDSQEALEELVTKVGAAPGVVVDVETTGKNPMLARLVGIALSVRPGEAYYVAVGHGDASGRQLPFEEVMARLQPALEDPRLPKVGHNISYDAIVLAEHGIHLKPLSFDTMIAAYLLGDKGLGLKELAFTRLGVEMTPISALIGSGSKQRTMAEVPLAEAAAYACADADMTGRLRELLEPELKERGFWKLFAEVEMPLVPLLVRMERVGIALDTSLLRGMSQELGRKMAELEQEIYESVGHRFNINSTQQLAEVLYKELRLPANRRTKTGYSTDAAVLEELRGLHPVIDRLLDYRQMVKLKSTYVDALPALLNPKTGRLHTSWNQTVAATGRLSSSDPNLQNIPIRTELGKQVRRAFIGSGDGLAGERWLLLGADYSQIELRVLAHLSQDPGLLAAFAADEDIHTASAAEVFKIPKEAVTPEQRRLAKMVNFGVIYGLSAFGLAQGTGLSREEAAQFISDYFTRYRGVQEYVTATKERARLEGYVETILGRRRHIPEINAGNIQVRLGAERMAINMPVQGTAADIMKLAMIQVQAEMDRRGLRSRMLLQVHDELIFEVPQGELEQMTALVQEVMPRALPLSVPLKVETKVGATWGDLE